MSAFVPLVQDMIDHILCRQINFSFPTFTMIREKVYAFKTNVQGFYNSEYKTHALVVLGRLLQFAALASATPIVVMAFTKGVTLLAALPLCAMLFNLGTCLLETDLPPQENYTSEGVRNLYVGGGAPSRIAGQPLPLANSFFSNSCWINAAMQCIMHIDALRERAMLIPDLQGWMEQYQQLQARSDPLNPMNMQSVISFFTPPFQAGAQNDISLVFERLLRDQPLYQFRQTRTFIDKRASVRQKAEPLICLQPLPSQLNVTELFNQFFNHDLDDGSRIHRQFLTCPETLVVKLNRFYTTGNTRATYRNHPLMGAVAGVDHVFQLGSSVVHSDREVNTDSAQYMTDAFILHTGGFNGGHYSACICKEICKERRWWHCDDGRIIEISEAQAMTAMRRSFYFFANRRH